MKTTSGYIGVWFLLLCVWAVVFMFSFAPLDILKITFGLLAVAAIYIGKTIKE